MGSMYFRYHAICIRSGDTLVFGLMGSCGPPSFQTGVFEVEPNGTRRHSLIAGKTAQQRGQHQQRQPGAMPAPTWCTSWPWNQGAPAGENQTRCFDN